MYELLNKINGPDDVKKLSISQLNELAVEVREGLFNRLTKIGGHFGPNFGMVEATIALHYVFNSPVDKFIFDVSHQSYTHKMLTGRKNGYINDECFAEDSGYTNPEESAHDLFNIGHTSTSISLATGMAKARDQFGGAENVIAIIGDGSLSGGQALEALSVAGSELESNLIIIVNDNQQSISETHGGIYKNLAQLRESDGKSSNNMFTAFGLEYFYEKNGNSIEDLIKIFQKVKNCKRPTVVHINTQKGKGYTLAEKNKEAWHWCMPFDRETGKPKFDFSGETYTDVAKKVILEKAKKDKGVVIVTPNMPMCLNLCVSERDELKGQFVDVGIAEEQAVAMASGIAKRGGHPVVVTNTTFMQRTYDQVSHDVCINKTPVTFLLNYTSFDGLTDISHLGIFGLSIFSNIPDLKVFAPSSKEELTQMLEYSLEQKDGPVMIMLPGNAVTSRPVTLDIKNENSFEIVNKGNQVAIIAAGDFFQRGQELLQALKDELKIDATLINPRYVSGIDTNVLDSLLAEHKLVITLEDGILEGGFGSKVSNYLGDKKIFVKTYGLKKSFYDRYNPEELLRQQKMDTDSIVEYVKTVLN